MTTHILLLTFLLTLFEYAIDAQINLGSFFLHPQRQGGFDMGMGQGANILGFGGDRSLNIAGNPAGFAMGSNNGAMIGGERVGVDGGIGAGNQGVEMGSQVQFGNQPNPMHPAGQLGSFLDNVKNFFAFLGNGMPPPSPASPLFPTMGLTTIPPRLIGTEGSGQPRRPAPWFPESSQESSSTPSDFDESPMEGETSKSSSEHVNKEKPKIDFNMDEEETDEIFNTQTDRPRQLPGLVEFA
ncbi:unnamed protein product [Caenorhabditis angaria]|uniref:Uncharacterized protein n=1 Tax=Caenorhabditis angaria TaxID=860376 RepID=A0A9P1IAV4_9PELO|nr:unnamed protein product [Caenorhabditis angaria]